MRLFRRVLVVSLTAACALSTLASPTTAHTIKPVYADTCTANWKTVAGAEKQVRCFATWFSLDPNKAASIVRCESGFRWNATSASGTYRGLWQYGGTWEAIVGHYLPQYPNESPYHGRRATIVAMRHARHIQESGGYPWQPWSCA